MSSWISTEPNDYIPPLLFLLGYWYCRLRMAAKVLRDLKERSDV